MKKFEMDLGKFTTLNNKIFDGKVYKTSAEYYEAFKNGMKKKIEEKSFPMYYEYPTGIQLELTYKCNQKCIHCYNQSGSSTIEKELTLNDWKLLAKRIGEIGVFQCIISGGEPTLLGEGLFEIIDILYSYGIELIFITNGMLLTKDLTKRLAKYNYTWFQVSIDGSRPEIHDNIRGVKSWDKALEAANYIKQAGLPLVISHALVKGNMEYLEEMVELAYLIGAKRIITGPFTYTGRAVLNADQIELTKDEKISIYERIRKLHRTYYGKMEVIPSMEEPLGLRVNHADINGGMLIRPNGDVKIDCIAPFKIGNVLQEDIFDIWTRAGKKIWEDEKVTSYIKKIQTSEDLRFIKPRINVDEDILIK